MKGVRGAGIDSRTVTATLVAIMLCTAGCRGSEPGRQDARTAAASSNQSGADGHETQADESALRAALLDPSAPSWNDPAPEVFVARFETTKGSFDVEVHRNWAPIGVDRFHNLVRHGYFDDSRFFRVVEDFIAQFGIPGDPAVSAAWVGQTIIDDPVVASNERGTLAYAMTGPDTRHTQIYFNLVDNIRLDSTGFAPFGRVTAGMEVVDVIYAGYGEDAGGGMRRGDQRRMLTEGNEHLDRDYPELDQIRSVHVVPARP